MRITPLATDNGGRVRAARHRRYVMAAVIVICLPAGLAAWLWVWALDGIAFPSAAEVTSQRVIALEAADGQALLPKGLLQLPPIPAAAMPATVTNAVLSIEDRRFYQRGAIDLLSVLRAVVQNFEAGRVVSGASTITQQLAKTLYLQPARTYRRKIREAALAIWLESHLTKNQILTTYLNNVYLGSGATGFPAAAKLYFGKKVADLSLPEAAMLAGMINAPGEDDPLRNLHAARSRAAAVIDAMVANGKISQADGLEAKLNPATPGPAELSPSASGWFADWVYHRASAAVPPLAGAVTVRTTLDLGMQQLASNIVAQTLATAGAKLHATQAALVAMRPDGAVVAMVGGHNYSDSQFNRATQAKRQPGSAFKLFDYYAALRHGFTPGDTVLDGPIDVNGWEPEDYAHYFHGQVTLANAFAYSYNAAAVRLSQEVGIPAVIAAARDLGLHARLADNPSLALGTSEVTLLDLTAAYAAVRAGVAPVEPWAIATVSLPKEQRVVPIGPPHGPQHSLGQYQNELIGLLRGVVDHGTGHAAALSGFAAGKTGTAQDYRDAWFIGFSDALVVGVWVGNDDHSPMRRVVGGTLPAMIWKKFMEQAHPASSTTPVVAQQLPDQTAASTASSLTPPSAGHAAQEPQELFNQSTARPVGATCNTPVCERTYRSFRASDCTYQPYWGGARRFCDVQNEKEADLSRGGDHPAATSSPANRDRVTLPQTSNRQQRIGDQKTNDQGAARDVDGGKAHTAPGAAAAKCSADACRRYSSFRASDCTYQPYGGGARRSCNPQNETQDETAASMASRDRDLPADADAPDPDSPMDAPDRDFSFGPPPVHFTGPPIHW
ncbi:MAG: PBP1A family penicillin-binding protein [Hyphomicrobiales bacterium]|nr:PBP1A family penicillin-binding protein [Hyphomicrobiales bacterium]